jgi:trehalose/maltose hydrolase-like predicted phosphorylase
MSIYNNWKYSYTFSNNVEYLDDIDTPPIVGNGKIAVLPSFDGIKSIKKCFISTNVNDQQTNNVIETFNVGKTEFLDTNNNVIESSNINIELDMYSGILTNTLLNNNFEISTDVYTPYHLPFCLVKTIRITPLTNINELTFNHEVYAPSSLIGAKYNNNVFFNDATNTALHAFTGSAKTATNKTVSMCSGYIIDQGNDLVIDYNSIGFNVYDQDTSRAFNRIKLRNLSTAVTYRIHIISVHMTSDDYENPDNEVKKILININNKGITHTRSTHVKSWGLNWLTDFQLVGKDGITSDQSDKVNELKGLCRLTLYHMYSLTRELVTLRDTFNIGFVDINGDILYQGDLFMIPLILLLKPNLGQSLLNYRYDKLNTAIQLAASYGFKGSKYPYSTDSIGYKNSLYWNPRGTMTYYNTALVSINVWNYYRTTLDKSWLSEVGHNILKNNANFFVSTLDDNGDILDVYSISGVQSEKNNTFTNNLIKHAVKCAIESSYELGFIALPEWKTLLESLELPKNAIPNEYVYKFDNDTLQKTEYAIAEPLFLFVPYYNSEYVERLQYQNTTRAETIKSNLDEHIGNVTDINSPINSLLRIILHMIYTQHSPTSGNVLDIEVLLDLFLDQYKKGIFNNITSKDSVTGFDITLGSCLLFILLQGIMQLNIRGGVSETRFYYEEFRLCNVLSAKMPSYWKYLKVITKINNYITFSI